MKIFQKIFFTVFLFIGITANAQDPQFSQFYANPLLLNPAFAGSAGCSRMAINLRSQWPNIPENYKTVSISYDSNLDSINSGFGFNYIYDVAGNTLFTHMFNAFYAYNIRCSENFIIKPALNFGMGFKSIDGSKFTPPVSFSSVNYFNVGAGVLLAYKNYTGGFAIDHLNEPDEGFESKSRLPMKFTAHASCLFNKNNKLKITPIIIFQKQLHFEELISMLLFNVTNIKFGAGCRTGFETPDCLIAMIGFRNNIISIGYSYDYTISKLSSANGGSHEISCIYKFNCKNKPVSFIVIPENY
ncbi:MAG TPA: PorP/SprF family type IX secretion system membrane protein [Bacteroidales bacterium]|nr:PorP/SprF family type IX secretion system membrane protein [Bacteroidales bacterium]HPS16693.1 PorP/SprF family type IX secretion system membrane protein [Bacteroidales bacterium]